MVRQAATTADIMGRTFHSLSWVLVGSDGEEDDMHDVDAPDVDAPAAVGDDDGGGVVVKCRYLQIAKNRSLVICSATGR